MDGQTISGDVVIAADGVHSNTRNIIAGDDSQPFLTGKSCYRYVTPISEIRKDPVTAQFVESPGCCLEVLGGDRSVIFYPCANNTSLYTGAFLPMSEVGSTEEGRVHIQRHRTIPLSESFDIGWGQAANKEKLLNSFSSFPSHIRALLEKAPEDSVQAWNLLDCPEVKRWTRGRAVLLGDAAHPFLPYMGQGAAMAIEDAACISALLQEGTTATAIPRLLELFQNYRKERVDRIAEFTRRRGRNFSGAEGPYPSPEEIAQIVQYCNNHDEWDNTTSKFKEWSARQKL
ncbi:Monooxygenase FAD-binding protein [Macrophomina phaseolina MS6]|uniref:Monooxygenase FAD-binding protein n=1 Tax=Macrophomina phaseolina (strain MS6) TaxID=1126212 RepID=K2S198_MACPH|nr:Monooxygenase FAD-binding protein [Macrophomina phaseolina MS6]